jgi:hypothetical protein
MQRRIEMRADVFGIAQAKQHETAVISGELRLHLERLAEERRKVRRQPMRKIDNVKKGRWQDVHNMPVTSQRDSSRRGNARSAPVQHGGFVASIVHLSHMPLTFL